MSGFWTLSDGTTAEATTNFDAGGGGEPIPNETGCRAAIEDPKWGEYEGENYISLRWRIAAPAAYANRVVFQKIYVDGKASAKSPQEYQDKAIKMLIAIDTNAGGGLVKVQGRPSNDDLMRCLSGKMMGIKVMLWEMNGKSGNWIGAVAPLKSAGEQPASNPMQAQPAQPARTTPKPPPVDGLDDDIPF